MTVRCVLRNHFWRPLSISGVISISSVSAMAQTVSIDTLAPEAIDWWLTFVPTAVFVVATAVLFQRLRRARAHIQDLTAKRDRNYAMLDAGPFGHLRFDEPTSSWNGDRALDRVLEGSGAEPATLEQLWAALGPAESLVVPALEVLVADGQGFSLEVPGACAGSRFRLIGARVPESGEPVVWVEDIRDTYDKLASLNRERSRLRDILDALPLPVWQRGTDLALEYVNSTYREAVEVAPDRLLLDVPELGAGVIGADGKDDARRAHKGGEGIIAEYHIVIGGARRLLEIHERAPKNGLQVGVALDRTRAEDLARDLDRLDAAHNEMLHTLTSAIAIFDADQRMMLFNSAFQRLWGLEESWLYMQPSIDELAEALREQRRLPEIVDFPTYKAGLREMFTSVLEPTETLEHLPDGTTLRQIVAPHPFGGLVFIWEDVTDRLALERSYNTLIAVQRETLDQLFEGVAVIGGDGRLKLSNPAFGRIWRISVPDLDAEPHVTELQQHMDSLLGRPAQDTDASANLIDMVQERSAQSGRLERIDGTVLDYHLVPLPDGAMLLSYIDVSDTVQVERVLRERNEALETADQLKSEFIANVSYELRTPLNTIIGFSEILSDQYFGTLNERQMEYSRGILESSQRLLSLINDILDLATIEAGHMALELDSIDLYAMLSSVLSLIRERARHKKLTVEFDCSEDIGVIVADERRLKQALFNILNNSVRFTPESGIIRVAARRAQDELVLSIGDTGVGIPEQDRTRVFGKFERGVGATARDAGAGLGLSLVKSFIEMHGGRVELESDEGEGTRVICYLPARLVPERLVKHDVVADKVI